MADEPKFMAVRDGDLAFRQTLKDAQSTLPVFHRLLESEGAMAWYPCVKTRVTSGEERALIWLLVVGVSSSGFTGKVFEIPREFTTVHVGDRIDVPNADVMDWMANRDGTLHGGYSLRYQRSLLPPENPAWYYQYIGVSKYAPT